MSTVGSGWNRDTAVGLLGAVLLIGAMSGVFFYERSQFHTYDVTWVSTSGDPQTSQGTLETGGSSSSATHTFTVEATDVASGTITLTWTDDVGDPDTFRLAAEGPADQTVDPVEGQGGELTLVIPVYEAPTTDTATGRDIEQARDQIHDLMGGEDGTGEWTVTVTLIQAPGEASPGGITETTADGSNTYDLRFVHHAWTPRLTER